MALNPPPQIKGISQADLANWRHHPVSKVLLQYLQDYHLMLSREAWAHLRKADKLDIEYLAKLTGRADAALEFSELPFEALQSFYTTEISEEENGTEAVSY